MNLRECKREEATTTRRHSTAARRPTTTSGANAPDRGTTHRMPPRATLSLTPQPIRPHGWPPVDMPGAKPLLVPPGRGGATTAKSEARVGVGTRAAPQTRTGSKDTVMIVWYTVQGLMNQHRLAPLPESPRALCTTPPPPSRVACPMTEGERKSCANARYSFDSSRFWRYKNKE